MYIIKNGFKYGKLKYCTQPDYNQIPSSLVAQLVEKWISVLEVQHGKRDLFFFTMWAHFLSRAKSQKVLFGIIVQHFNLIYLNYFMYM